MAASPRGQNAPPRLQQGRLARPEVVCRLPKAFSTSARRGRAKEELEDDAPARLAVGAARGVVDQILLAPPARGCQRGEAIVIGRRRRAQHVEPADQDTE